MILVAELAETPAQTMLGCGLALMGTDGYGTLTLETAWNSLPDPSSGTLFCPQVPIGDCRPDFIFKVCHRSKYSVLAIECGDAGESAPERPERSATALVRRARHELYRSRDRGGRAGCVTEIETVRSEMVEGLFADAGEIRGGPTRWLRKSMTPVGRRPPQK